MPVNKRAVRWRGWIRRKKPNKQSASNHRAPVSQKAVGSILRPRAFYLGNFTLKDKGYKSLAHPNWNRVCYQQRTPLAAQNKSWKRATYRWASHTWSRRATTSHRACCTRSAWTPREQCSQECLPWRRPETRTTRQEAQQAGRCPELFWRPKATSTTSEISRTARQLNGKPDLPEHFPNEHSHVSSLGHRFCQSS